MQPTDNWITHEGKSALEHVVVASYVLGRPLPDGAQVHHVDEDGHNNALSNLVICPSKKYHKLLHVRMRALTGSGNANWLKCHFCQKWDDPKNMRIINLKGKPERAEHAECQRKYQRDRYHAKPNT